MGLPALRSVSDPMTPWSLPLPVAHRGRRRRRGRRGGRRCDRPAFAQNMCRSHVALMLGFRVLAFFALLYRSRPTGERAY